MQFILHDDGDICPVVRVLGGKAFLKALVDLEGGSRRISRRNRRMSRRLSRRSRYLP